MAAMVVLALAAGVLIGVSVTYGRMSKDSSAAWMEGWKAGVKVVTPKLPDQPVVAEDRMGELLAHIVKATFPEPRDTAPTDQPDMDAGYDIGPDVEVADWTDALPGLAEMRPDVVGGPPGGFALPNVEPVDLGGGDQIA